MAVGIGNASAAERATKEIRPPYVPDSPELKRCESKAPDDRNGTQWGSIVVCLRGELARQDKRLNDAYGAVRKEFEAKGAVHGQMLIAGQKAWLTYRDAWCKVEENSGEPPPPELLSLSCKVELTVEQTGRLLDQKN